MPPKPIASAGCNTSLFLCKKLKFQIKIYTQTRVSCSISLKFSRGNIYALYPVNIVNQFSSETLQKIRLSCHEVEATIVLKNVMKVYTFLRRIRYKKLTQLCVKWFQNRNRND